jgi:hypothetical protein
LIEEPLAENGAHVDGSGGEENALAAALEPIDEIALPGFEEECEFAAHLGGAAGEANDFLRFGGHGGDLGFDAFERSGEIVERGTMTIEERSALGFIEGIAAFAFRKRFEEMTGTLAKLNNAAEKRRSIEAGEAKNDLGIARELLEAVAGDLAAEIIAGHRFDFVGFVENDGGVIGEDRAEIVLADGEIGEEEMVIDDDEIGFMSALMHSGDEAAAEFGAILSGAGVAAGIETLPEIGIVGKKIELGAVAGLRDMFPIHNLLEPIDLIEALEDRLAGHLMKFLAAEKIPAALHDGGAEIGREMAAKEGNVFLKELFLKRLGGGGDNDAAAAANSGNQVS